jgi:tetratricopeptide (TPR) repeat protein
MMILRLIRLLSLAALLSATAAAQSAAMSHHDHSVSVRFRDLPPPPLMQGIGDASLKITTKSDAAQQYFNQGLRLLHCFWDFEAYRAFKEAASQDPDAAMAYWGEFEALRMHGLMTDDMATALDKAKSVMAKASEHEQFYIRAAEHEKDWDKSGEPAAYRHEMENLIDKYPEDVDAQAFLALALLNGYDTDGHPRDTTLYGRSILMNLLTAHPDNAAANHYWIHAMEGSRRPEAALHSADILKSLAPNSGHMVHMPGHIYWRVGDYEKARQAFLDSVAVEEAYMKAQGIKPEEDWNYPHNLAYLIAACAESGRYREGLDWAKKLHDIPTPIQMTSGRFVVWAGASVARVHIVFGDWRAVSENPVGFGMDPDAASAPAREYSDGLSTYARGMAAIEGADFAEASKQAEALDAQLWRLEAAEPQKTETDSQPPPDENYSEILKILGTMSLDLRGNLDIARGNATEGIDLIQQAADKEKTLGYSEPPRYFRPEQESLGYAYLKLRQWDTARDALNAALSQRPKSGHALYGIAQSYALSGDVTGATTAYHEFLAAWPHADSDLPQVKQARSWLATHSR